VNLQNVLDETERFEILSALESSKWVVAGPNGAAARLGMKRTTLNSRMQRLGISLLRTPFSERRLIPSANSDYDQRVVELPVQNPPHVDGDSEAWSSAFA
jgi:hypothetical protein